MRLFSPKTDATRPITDRVKQSVFDVLANYDLLAGANLKQRSRVLKIQLTADIPKGVI